MVLDVEGSIPFSRPTLTVTYGSSFLDSDSGCPLAAPWLRRCRRPARSRLRFKLEGMPGELHAVSSEDVNRLLRAVTDVRYRAVLLHGHRDLSEFIHATRSRFAAGDLARTTERPGSGSGTIASVATIDHVALAGALYACPGWRSVQ